LITHDPRIVVN